MNEEKNNYEQVGVPVKNQPPVFQYFPKKIVHKEQDNTEPQNKPGV
ncbi:MAG TPA: hypothetical protein PLP64_09305 [Pseudothermotoga sp.]|nr:hypothetical protein [Pseudothermotoga sp.]HOK84402.1 hypothetical protein [Pseudothermotoga sp.]HPP70588.1 hypothetical protein [Pseudothermotoga sp.]